MFAEKYLYLKIDLATQCAQISSCRTNSTFILKWQLTELQLQPALTPSVSHPDMCCQTRSRLELSAVLHKKQSLMSPNESRCNERASTEQMTPIHHMCKSRKNVGTLFHSIFEYANAVNK